MIELEYNMNPEMSPLLATAIHRGHHVRQEAEKHMAVNEFERLKEEDPFTAFFTPIAASQLAINTSRFEVDVNRPRKRAVYRNPDDAWGIKVWKDDVPAEVWEDSLKNYDDFYNFLRQNLQPFIDRWGYILVLDIHSFNSSRASRPDKQEDDPDINIGTRTLDKNRWGSLVKRFMNDLREFNYPERKLEVVENVKFRGGYFSEWIHENFPGKSCCLAVELKKFFMDEVSGAVDIDEIKHLKLALASALPGMFEEAERLQV